jgi:hypothetical protein
VIATRVVAWMKDDPWGSELVEASISSRTLSASGVAIGSDPAPYRLDYALETDDGFVTARLQATARGEGWRHELDLRRSASGTWSANIELPDLAGALDCDLGLSPLTNSMPVLRHDLLGSEGSVELVMAWVSVPDLTVSASRQRYTALGDNVVRYDSLDGTFSAELAFDSDGLVVDYPDLARRVPTAGGC